MSATRHAVVTGAFSNIGLQVAVELRSRGWRVSTLTNRAPADGDDPSIKRSPLEFDEQGLARALDGADAFVNTYWIRFPHRGHTFEQAIENSAMLVRAAERAGVGRFVQVGVSNASLDSELGYYRGKAQVDELVRESPLNHAIVRPTLVVGPKDVLTGNMAWFLRRMPIIAVPAGPGYDLQPVTLADTARIIVNAAEADATMEVDAAGPDRMHFRTYLEIIARALGRRPRFVPLPAPLMVGAVALFGLGLRDVVLTRQELAGLKQCLLTSNEPALGTESVPAWLDANIDVLGTRYVNDTRHRFRPIARR